jgi:hypothetical protein
MRRASARYGVFTFAEEVQPAAETDLKISLT